MIKGNRKIYISYPIPYGMPEPIYKYKQDEDGYTIEIKIIRVKKDRHNPEGVKYSLVAINKKTKKRELGFDNSERKGHHIHKGEREIKYNFIDEWKLIEDFYEEYEKIKRRQPKWELKKLLWK